MDFKLLAVYFFVGGLIVSFTAYFGSQGRGLLAAFIGVLPSVTLITILAIYLNSGLASTLSYVKGMLVLLPAWILYVIALIFLMPRIGLLYSILASVAVYLIVALPIVYFVKNV